MLDQYVAIDGRPPPCAVGPELIWHAHMESPSQPLELGRDTSFRCSQTQRQQPETILPYRRSSFWFEMGTRANQLS